jgi:hypothetical protein
VQTAMSASEEAAEKGVENEAFGEQGRTLRGGALQRLDDSGVGRCRRCGCTCGRDTYLRHEFRRGVACVSSTVCVAVGTSSSQTQGAVVVIKKGVPGKVHQVSAASSLNGIACWSASSCAAVGESSSATQGVVVPVTNSGAIGTAIPVSSTTILAGIGCELTPSTTCFAVGQGTNGYGVVLPLSAGTPGTATYPLMNVSTLNGVGCASSTKCIAVGESLNGEVVPITKGQVGSPVTVGSAGSLFGAACPSKSVCDVVGGDTSGHSFVVTVTNGVPAATGHVLTSISTFYAAACFGTNSRSQ